ncbi:hypothetical protein [Amaricoccus sp.]|uniref:hypothetical protein n=1 Tax=Amaricoccus sp. TaxID=1872485 RepID=UPI001B4BC88D|nr:hypothetical protein [Amaricoccus sp.]MBP7242050.1 hypothetical protein [Amaricoccus sp.]
MEFIVYLIGMALVLVPMWKLTGRSGINPAWSLVCLLPAGIVVMLWVLAYRDPGRAT